MSTVKLENAVLNGTVTIPPSKSAAHRALVCSFLAGGGTVAPMIESDDMRAMQQVIAALQSGSDILNCLESGNTLRFMIPVAAALGKTVTFTGEGRLPERPLRTYLKLLPQHGVQCECDGALPLRISGKLEAGCFAIAGNISSQYITGLLLALPILEGDSEIVLTTKLMSKPYVDMTLKVMRDYGVLVNETEKGYFIKGGQRYAVRDYTVESDWSQAAFFLAAGALGGDITLTGLDMASVQGDKEIVPILKQFGAEITEINGTLRSKKAVLSATAIDATDIPDTVPMLAVTAAFAKGTTVINGTERLRYKESDRIKSITENLRKMGITVNEEPDRLTIIGGEPHGAALCGYNDHRIVMAFSIAALNAKGITTISDAESIHKTYPSFFEDYNALGGKADVIRDR